MTSGDQFSLDQKSLHQNMWMMNGLKQRTVAQGRGASLPVNADLFLVCWKRARLASLVKRDEPGAER